MVVQGTQCYHGVHLATAAIQLARKASKKYINGTLRTTSVIARKAKSCR